MMIRKSSMTAESRAVIHHLRANGPTSIGELCKAFPSQDKHVMSRRLHKMRSVGWLHAEGARGALVWSMHPDAERLLPALESGIFVDSMHSPMRPRNAGKAVRTESMPSVDPDLVAKPRTYEFAPYQPSRPTATRPGSLAFRDCPSRGLRC